ncbi:hypothetical protein GX50_05080 [[Emmonsia] crescens]|uniref:DUF6604 domain-containing protein n=1 Tax=[Emmonsia] crescens TaxID=73230 RepID=A0A2B7ZG03_9EURO|nr:hypothetical protein GX50_05080 [Emmonsia crescens]
MLSDFITSSYLQYKADTDAVASWLTTTAGERGYLMDLQTGNPSSQNQEQQQQSKRLKGKARKQARQACQSEAEAEAEAEVTAPTRTLPVKEFARLANYLAAATDPPVVVPASFVTSLDRAITTRREHGTELSSRVPRDEESRASDDRHVHFIGVLEHVREVLRPRFARDQVKCAVAKPAKKPVQKKHTQIISNLANKFESPGVQEPSKEFINAPNVRPTTATTKVEEVNHEEQNPPDDVAAPPRFLLLLQDYYLLRTFLIHAWTQYRDEVFKLECVSLATNTAIDIARRMCEDVDPLLEEHVKFKTILAAIYFDICKQSGHDPMFCEQPRDIINFQPYDAIEGTLLPAYILLEQWRNASPNGLPPEGFPAVPPNYPSTYDPKSDRSNKSGRDKFKEDHILLGEIISEFLVRAISPTQPFEDEFTRGLRLMFDTGVIPIWLVFAAQVFLDIHHVLRAKAKNAFTNLFIYAGTLEYSIKQHFEFGSCTPCLKWPEQNDIEFQNLLRCIKQWVRSDSIGAAKIRAGRVAEESLRLMRGHPLLCNTLSLLIKTHYRFEAVHGPISGGLQTNEVYRRSRKVRLPDNVAES